MEERRNLTDQFMAKVALEAPRGEKTVLEIAAKHQLTVQETGGTPIPQWVYSFWVGCPARSKPPKMIRTPPAIAPILGYSPKTAAPKTIAKISHE